MNYAVNLELFDIEIQSSKGLEGRFIQHVDFLSYLVRAKPNTLSLRFLIENHRS